MGSDDSGAGRWLVDHLFLDQDAVPTLVEVKRSSDTRIRREVVGQMLDYAANAVVYWRVDALRATFEANCARRGADPAMVLANVLDPDADADEFWIRVRTNFAAGRLRLVFVADAIPDELRRIVEFLDKQMVSTDVLAIEIKQYVDADGQHQTLVPRLVGRTEAARQTKGRSARVWNRDSILQDIATRRGTAEAEVARKIFQWADRRGDLRTWFGSGQQDGSFAAGFDNSSAYLFPFTIYTYGNIEITFQWMRRRPPFDAEGKRVELQRMLNAIPGVRIPDDGLEKLPRISLGALTDDAHLKAFLDAIDWSLAEAKAVGRIDT